MAAYINGIGLISPQKTADTDDFLAELVETEAEYMKCIDPVFRNYIDPIASRRMSRLIKIGLSSAKMCIADSGNITPEAIITGTGLGSVEETEKILGTMREDENFCNPTPFIQSTYNTISSQIAINLKCHGYNSTYVHRIFSFESGLQDALMQIDEKMASDLLVGGVDEMTMNHLLITRRANHWKTEPVNNLKILDSGTPGALAGEGSAWFMLSDKPSDNCYARIKAVETFYLPKNELPVNTMISQFLDSHGMTTADVDLILLGNNGDNRYDKIYYDLSGSLFKDVPSAYYKHLCGEYHTSTGFALWLAANIIKRNTVPAAIRLDNKPLGAVKTILIYNQFYNKNHSLILVA